ncbi:hypothetical protein FACS1894110_19410 [Spirochaetia bacterium]|nr:hypothetical protein FACS1894110_19410 [Spirochaetia bacterium]
MPPDGITQAQKEAEIDRYRKRPLDRGKELLQYVFRPRREEPYRINSDMKIMYNSRRQEQGGEAETKKKHQPQKVLHFLSLTWGNRYCKHDPGAIKIYKQVFHSQKRAKRAGFMHF